MLLCCLLSLQGVKIVTDERATSVAASVGDDAGAIASLIERLTAGVKDLPASFRMAPVQFEKVSRRDSCGAKVAPTCLFPLRSVSRTRRSIVLSGHGPVAQP